MFISNQLLKKSNYRIEDKKVIAFQSNVVLKNLQKMQADVFVKESAFTSFISQVSKSYPQEKTMDVIFKSLVPQNFLGSGRCAKVYEIPHVKDFVVRVLHNVKPESLVKCEIKPVKDEFPNYNFGQKIADNGEGVTILKRVLGVSQSFPEPREKDKSGVFKVVHSQTVLQQIVEMAKFPQESFDDFALKVKEINKSPKYMLDCLNPNNLLVDKENQRFNVVDLAERKNFVALAGPTAPTTPRIKTASGSFSLQLTMFNKLCKP